MSTPEEEKFVQRLIEPELKELQEVMKRIEGKLEGYTEWDYTNAIGLAFYTLAGGFHKIGATMFLWNEHLKAESPSGVTLHSKEGHYYSAKTPAEAVYALRMMLEVSCSASAALDHYLTTAHLPRMEQLYKGETDDTRKSGERRSGISREGTTPTPARRVGDVPGASGEVRGTEGSSDTTREAEEKR
jgi:hypothetical protein